MVTAAEMGSAANNYRVLAKLATGGMAEIYLARLAGVGGVARYVVLKKALRDRVTDPQFVQMFLEEAQLAAQLNHPNVAQVLDIGQLGDSFFFTMEYVHGETVLQLIRSMRAHGREVPIPHVLTIVAHAAAGLHHAHERIGVDGSPLGIVHRDVSPSNLMVSYEGTVKLVDFGVAKADTRTTETRTGAVKGKVTYLSPEQCRGFDVDRRSDLFSLGIVMWEVLTREKLFHRGSDFDVMTAIVNEPIPPPSTHRNLPAEIDRVVMRLLAKDPEDRYQSAAELIEDVEQIAAQQGTPLSPAALGKFMRDVYGEKPEPWLEYERDSRDGVSVMSDPLPGPDEVQTVRVGRAAVADMLARLPVAANPFAQQPVVTAVPILPVPGAVTGPVPAPRSAKVTVFGAVTAIAVGVVIAVFVSRQLMTRASEAEPPPADAVPSTEAPARLPMQPDPLPDDALPARVASPTDAGVETPDAAAARAVDAGLDPEPDDELRVKRPWRRPPKRPDKTTPPPKDCSADPMSCQH